MMKLSGKIGKLGVVVAVVMATVICGVANGAKDRQTVEGVTAPPSSTNYSLTASVYAISTKPDPNSLLYYVQVFGGGVVTPVTTVNATVSQSQCTPPTLSGSGSGSIWVGYLNGTFISGVTDPAPASTMATAPVPGLQATATCTPDKR